MLNFLSTWGDPYYLGLTGLEVIGREGETIDVNMDMVSADPQDLHVLPGYESDDRTLDKYVLLLCTKATVSFRQHFTLCSHLRPMSYVIDKDRWQVDY